MRYERMRKTELVAMIAQLKDEKISDPPEAARLLQEMRISYSQENFVLIVMDNKMHVLKRTILFKGGLTESPVDLKVLFQTVLTIRKATSIIIAHNHPTNNITPSCEDIAVTKRIDEACKLLGLSLLDHIIFCETGSFFSLKSVGYL